jgi:NADH-quinone oxidoreductase subunit H
MIIEWLQTQWIFSAVLTAVVAAVILGLVAYASLFERKIAAWCQDRHGPNRVGFFGVFGWRLWGLGQPIADGLKFFVKEDIVPAKADKPLYVAAPAICLIVATMGFAVIPWGGVVDIDGDGQWDVRCQVASLDIGLLYLLGLGAMGVYGVVLGGWASNNKYSLYGALRGTAQLLSYEIPIGLAILVAVLMAGSVRLEEIILAQVGEGNCWYAVKHPLAFLLLWAAMFAETNRMPFDLPEAEQELVSGYLTEYSSMKFSMFFMAEYTHMIVGTAFLSVLFLGGWHIPFIPWLQPESTSIFAMLCKMAVMVGKVVFFMWLYMLVRWTLPRFRFDQLMRLAWQKMVPAGIGLAGVAAVVVYIRGSEMSLWREIVLCWVGNAAVVVVAVLASLLARQRGDRVTGRQDNMPVVPAAGSGA